MSSKINAEMRIMQDNLCELRKIAGWTAETLAGKLGVTKQTISNLETQKVKISRIQYIAIRVVFECEMSMNSENTTLRKVMGILFDGMTSRYEAHREAIRTAMVSIASIAMAGISGLQLHSSAVALLSPIGHANVLTNNFHSSEPSLKWMVEHLESGNDTEIEECIEENKDENS